MIDKDCVFIPLYLVEHSEVNRFLWCYKVGNVEECSFLLLGLFIDGKGNTLCRFCATK